MRNILFRGYSTVSKEWIYGDLAHTTDRIVHISNEQCFVSVKPETIGQYTGVTDKNGVKIFEDDIVKLYLIDGIEKGVIKFNDIMCRFMFVTKDGSYGFDRDCIFEIIGNIHNNPELLSN